MKYINKNQFGQDTFGMYQNTYKNQNDMFMMPENFMDTRNENNMNFDKKTKPPTGRATSRGKDNSLPTNSQQNIRMPINNSNHLQNTYHHNLPLSYSNAYLNPNIQDMQNQQNTQKHCILNTNAYSDTNQQQIMNHLNSQNDYRNHINANPERTYFSNDNIPNFSSTPSQQQNFSFGMTNNNLSHNYESPEFQATLRNNIDKLGGLQTTLPQMKNSLFQNELRHIEMNNNRIEMTNQPMPKHMSELNNKAVPINFNNTDQNFSSRNQFNYENTNNANLNRTNELSDRNQQA